MCIIIINFVPSLTRINRKPAFWIFIGNSGVGLYSYTTALTLYQWQMLTTTFDGKIMKIYINGILINNLGFNASMSPSLNRTSCYIGKSWSITDGVSWSYLDDLRFYNKCLNQSDIITLMNSNTSKPVLILLGFVEIENYNYSIWISNIKSCFMFNN